MVNPNPAAGRGLNLGAKLKALTWGLAVPGIIEDFVPGEVTILTDDAIAEGTSLNVEIIAFAFDGEVLSSRPRGSRHELHVAIKDAGPQGLRKTPRFPVDIPARIFSSCLEGPQKATITDISGDGLGLVTNMKLANDATLAIESQSNIALGLVKYSHPLSPAMYRSGVVLHHIIPRPAGSGPGSRSILGRASRLALRALRLRRTDPLR